jgi:hypothetical protein
MNSKRRSRMIAASVALLAPAIAGVVVAAPGAWAAGAPTAARDTAAPTVPGNPRQMDTYNGQPVLGWSAASDDSGKIDHYSVLIDGAQAYRPRAATVRVSDLVAYCHVSQGQTYTVTIKAVDRAGNASPASAPMTLKVS